MNKLLKSTLSATLLMVLILSCGGTSLLDEAEKGISEGNYDAAIAAADSALMENPDNLQAYYVRGLAYAEKASSLTDVAERQPLYANSREAMDNFVSKQVMEKDRTIAELQASNTMNQKWSMEHNAAIALATNSPEAPQVDDPLEVAAAHLINATTINPDSVLSYEILSEVYRMQGNYAQAAESYQDVFDLRGTPTAEDYDRMGVYYMQMEDYDSAVDVLSQGVTAYPDSVFLSQKLTDSYFNLGNVDMGIETLNNLIERDPENAQYHLVLGTQVYNLAADKNAEISDKYNMIFDMQRQARNLRGAERDKVNAEIETIREEISTLRDEVNALSNRAVDELSKVLELRPEDASAYHTLGVVYQNKAATLFEERNATEDNDRASELNTLAVAELENAMKNYEKATEIDEDNQDYWGSLFRVYTLLGMNEKAEEAMKKAGM